MKGMKKILVIFLALLFFGSMIPTIVGSESRAFDPGVDLKNIGLGPHLPAETGEYLNDTYIVTVTVENIGETILIDLNVTCKITNATSTMLDDWNTTITTLAIGTTADVIFDWVWVYPDDDYTINATVTADGFGTEVSDWELKGVRIEDVTSFKPIDVSLYNDTWLTTQAYNGAYNNTWWSTQENPAEYKLQVTIANTGNQPTGQIVVEASIYDGNTTAANKYWTNDTTVSSIAPGKQDFATFTGNFTTMNGSGNKTVEVQIPGTGGNDTFLIMVKNIANLMVSIVNYENGSSYNALIDEIQVRIQNNGNTNLSDNTAFTVDLDISNKTGDMIVGWSNSTTITSANIDENVTHPGGYMDVYFTVGNVTDLPGWHWFNVTINPTGEFNNSDADDNTAGINITLENTTGKTLEITSPTAGKYDVDDTGGLDIKAKVTNTGNSEDEFASGYWFEVSYKNLNTGEVITNMTNDTESQPLTPGLSRETDIGAWYSLLNYNAEFEITVALSLAKGTPILLTDTVLVTLAGGETDGAIAGTVTGIRTGEDVLVTAYTAGTTDIYDFENIVDGTYTVDGDYEFSLPGNASGIPYDIYIVELFNYYYDLESEEDVLVQSGRETPDVDFALNALDTGRINGSVELTGAPGYPDVPAADEFDDWDLVDVNVVGPTPNRMTYDNPNETGWFDFDVLVGLLNVSVEGWDFTGNYDDNVTVTKDNSTTVEGLIIVEDWAVSLTPIHGAEDVALNGTIVAIFDDPLNTSTVNNNTFKLLGPDFKQIETNATSYKFSNMNKTVTLTPSGDATEGTMYYILMDSMDIEDPDGWSIIHRDWNSSFTTKIGKGTVNGTVTDADGALEGVTVGIGEVSVLTDVNGTYELSVEAGEDLTITASKANYEDTTALVTVVAGGGYTVDLIMVEKEPPFSFTPTDGEVNVTVDANIELTFDQAMNETSINNDTFTLTSPGTRALVPGAITASADNKTFTLNPVDDLLDGTVYTWKLMKTISLFNSSAPWYHEDLEYTFTTVGVDIPEIKVTSTDPAEGDTDVEYDADVSITFDTAINQSSFEEAFSISPTVAGNTAINWSGNTVTWSHVTEFAVETPYTVTIDSTKLLPDDAGLKRLKDDFVLTFTTKPDIPTNYTITIDDDNLVNGAKGKITIGTKTFEGTVVNGVLTIIVPIADWIPGNYTITMSKDDYDDVKIDVTLNADGTSSNGTVKKMAEEDEDPPFNWLVIVAIIIVVIIIIILLAFAMKPKKEAEEELEEEEEEEEGEEEEFECPECGAVVSGGETTCPECGAEFDEEEFECPECGATIEGGSTVCPECGAEFEEEEEEGEEEEGEKEEGEEEEFEVEEDKEAGEEDEELEEDEDEELEEDEDEELEEDEDEELEEEDEDEELEEEELEEEEEEVLEEEAEEEAEEEGEEKKEEDEK